MKYLKNVVTLRLDQDRCTGCGMCLTVCPHQVFGLRNGSPRVCIQNRDACMECGACSRNCPAEAISVKAGVGCAYAIVLGRLRRTDPTCGCSESGDEGPSCCG
jgi:ferredoxin